MMNIGIIDADLLDNGTKFPNLVCMKLSSYHKQSGDNVHLLQSYDGLEDYDKVYIAKVFAKTKVPIDLNQSNIVYNGTGFYYDKAQPLEPEIEHTIPDYALYPQELGGGITRIIP